MAKLMRLVDDVLAIVALISLFLLIVTPVALAIEDSDVFYDDIEVSYDEDLSESTLYSIHGDYKPALSPEPYPGFQTEVKKCLQKISDDCGVIIFNRVFDNGKYSDVEECCGQLLTLGKKCHHAIVESTIASPEMKGVHKTKVWENSDKLWKDCASLSI